MGSIQTIEFGELDRPIHAFSLSVFGYTLVREVS